MSLFDVGEVPKGDKVQRGKKRLYSITSSAQLRPREVDSGPRRGVWRKFEEMPGAV
jgi:hypothetical protein